MDSLCDVNHPARPRVSTDHQTGRVVAPRRPASFEEDQLSYHSSRAETHHLAVLDHYNSVSFASFIPRIPTEKPENSSRYVMAQSILHTRLFPNLME